MELFVEANEESFPSNVGSFKDDSTSSVTERVLHEDLNASQWDNGECVSNKESLPPKINVQQCKEELRLYGNIAEDSIESSSQKRQPNRNCGEVCAISLKSYDDTRDNVLMHCRKVSWKDHQVGTEHHDAESKVGTCEEGATCNSCTESRSAVGEDGQAVYEEISDRCEAKQGQLSRSTGRLNHSNADSCSVHYEKKIISQTKESEVKITICRLPDFKVDDADTPGNFESCYETLSTTVDYDYHRIGGNPCEAKSLSSRTPSLEDFVAELPTTTKGPFHYPFTTKKHLFSWRRPSDITDLQSQQMWVGDREIHDDLSLTPTRRRHSENVPGTPRKYLNTRLNNLREIWNGSNWMLNLKSMGKPKEKRDVTVEVMSDADAEKDDTAKLIRAMKRQENIELVLDNLRQVVRKCTNPNPALRPSSAEIYRQLHKYSQSSVNLKAEL